MNRKEILTIILLICVIFSLQAVSAADSGVDDTDSNVLSVDNVSSYALPNSKSIDPVGNANEGSFTDLQGIVNGGSEITLTKNYTYNSATDSALKTGVKILTGTKTINGNGNVILDGNQMSRIFFVGPNANVTFKGITFVNANATALPDGTQTGHGGSILANGEVHIDNCKFEDNTATYGNGGGVFIKGNGSTITNSHFKNNRAINNGKDGIGAGGSLFIVEANNVKISHSIFEYNYAGLNGGAIASKEGITNCTIVNCTFEHNTANGSAGAVGMQSTNFKMYNSTFKHNEAKGLFTGTVYYPGNGGGIVVRAHDSYVYNTTFINNTAKLYGGASFLTNTTKDPTNNNTKYELCTFINNTAGSNGGALYWVKGAHYGYVLNSTFTNNTAKRSGGAVYWFGTIGIIEYSNFTNNTALGIVEDKDSYGNLTYGGNGGAIMWVGSDGTVYNCTFTGNNATNKGGAVYLQGSSEGLCNNTKFDTCTFISNVAGVNGGAIDWYRGARHGDILNSVFENNTANRSGGAVFWSGIGGEIINSNFTNNKALGIKEANDTYGNMTYGGYGGAVMWTGSNGTIDNCRFIGNEAKHNNLVNQGGRGGAVYLQGSATDNCTNTTFSNCNFTSNIAGTNGGAINWHEGAHDGKIINSTFDNNVAYSNGGAVYWRGHDGDIINSNFTNNTAKGVYPGAYGHVGDGGAIFWAGINGDVENCRFIDNEAVWNDSYVNGGRGGAVFLDKCEHGNKNTTFNNVYFENNVAGTNGGAIDWHEGAEVGSVDHGTFINNTAKRNGGAIFWHGVNGTIKNSRFENNRATGESWEYTLPINMGDKIVVDAKGNLILGDIIVLQQNHMPLPTDPSISQYEGKLVVLNYTSPLDSNILCFHSYVLTGNASAGYKWKELDGIDINVSDSIISPVDWAIDQYFGGDGGSILWTGDYGLVYNCTFIDSNSARRGGGAYMTGSDNVTYESCNFTNCTSGTNGGGVDWLAGANYGKIYNCIFNGTQAERSAGAIYYDGWYGDMQNITIINTRSNGGSLKQSKDGRVKYAGWDSSHWDTNTTGGDAGAIMYTGSNIKVYNVTFTNCTATGRGGAVFLQDNHNVTFDLCTFENNQALGIANNTYNDPRDPKSKLNVWGTGHGGAIGFDIGASEGKIINSKFINNTAARDGGAISFSYGSSNTTIYNSSFTNNTAKRNGGAFEWNGDNGNISYCNFTSNSALGMALDNVHVNLTSLSQVVDLDRLPKATADTTNLLFVLVTKEGGKKVKYELYVTIPLGESKYDWLKHAESNDTDASPTDWAIDQYYGGDGGSIVWGGNVGVIDNCRFIDSNSARRGGGAYMLGSDNVTVSNSYFENCTSGTNGGGLDWLAGANYGKVINCTFNNTRAARSAGAIYYDGDYGEMTNITIINATAFGGALDNSSDGKVKYYGWDASHWDTNTTGGDGGAMMFTGDYVNVYNVTFTNCTAAGRGGAVFLQANHDVKFEACTFEENSALGIANNTWKNYKEERNDANNDTKVDYILTGHGGAIAFDVGASEGTILNCTFNANHAARDGGAAYYAAGATKGYIINSTFTNHTINYDGGAIYLNGTYCEIHNSTFINNSAKDDGGAIFWQGAHGLIYNITCDHNQGTGTGENGTSSTKGGVICLTGSDMELTKSTFTNSFGGLLGGTLFVTGNNVNITDSVFINSTIGLEDGGAIYVLGNNTLIKNCAFDNCTAPNNGGVIYISGNGAIVENATITNADAIGILPTYPHIDGYCEENINKTLKQVDAMIAYLNTLKGGNITDGNITLLNNTLHKLKTDIGNILTDEGLVNSTNMTKVLISLNQVNTTLTNINNTLSSEESKKLNVLFDNVKNIKKELGEANNASKALDEYGKLLNDINNMINALDVLKAQGIPDKNITALNNTLQSMKKAAEGIFKDKVLDLDNIDRVSVLLGELNNKVNIINKTLTSAQNAFSNTFKDINNIKNELNKIINSSNIIKGYGNILIEIDAMIALLDAINNENITSDNITALNNTLQSIKSVAQSMLNDNVLNLTKVISVSNLLDELNSTLTKINGTLAVGDDEVNALFAHIKTVDNQVDNLCSVTKIYGNILAEIDAMIALLDTINNENITSDNITALNNTLQSIKSVAQSMLKDNVLNLTKFNNVSSLLGELNSTLTKINGTLAVGDDKVNVLFADITTIDGQLDDLCNVTEVSQVCADVLAKTNNMISALDALKAQGIPNENITALNNTLQSIKNVAEGIILKDSVLNFTKSQQVSRLLSQLSGTVNNIKGTLASAQTEFSNTFDIFDKAVENELDYLYDTADNLEISAVGGLGGAIYVSGDGATVKDSKISYTTAYKGGGIYVAGDGALVNNTEFTNLNATEDGGAIYVSGKYGNLYNSKFINNTVGDDGGAIYWDGDYGTVYNITSINNNGTGTGIPRGTSSTKGGAMIITGDHEVVSKSTFENSYAGLLGGTIFITGNDVNITDSSFKHSTVGLEDGGTLYILGNETNILNCTIEDSTARDGGAVFIEGHNATISVKFKNTNATLSGGSIYIEGMNATILNSTFDKTYAFGTNNNGGGAIFIKGNFSTVEGSKFNNNHADNDNARGGAIYINGLNATINCSDFKNSKSRLYGGAIYIDGKYTSVIGSNFTDCTVVTNVNNLNTKGGAIYVSGDNATIDTSNFKKSTATASSRSDGGFVYIDGKNATLSSSTFIRGITEKGNGGAIYINKENAVVYNCTVNNSESKSGMSGAIHLAGFNAIVNGSSFNNNKASKEGGAIYVAGGGAKVLYSNFTSNKGSDGGAIRWMGGHDDDQIIGCIFKYNNATNMGGAVSWNRINQNAKGNAFIKDCEFISNKVVSSAKSKHGGALHFLICKEVTIDNCIFIGNQIQSASGDGGAIYAGADTEDAYNLTVKNSRFINNTAKSGGGAFASQFRKNNTIINSTFIGNEASFGGDIVMKNQNTKMVVIDGCNFTNSKSIKQNDYGDGGGSLFINVLNATVANSRFNNCSSVIRGGAISWGGKEGKVYNSTFINCSSPHGGAVYAGVTKGSVGTGENFNLTNSKFINCNSSNEGGAIYLNSAVSTKEVSDLIIIGCYAPNGGGIAVSGKDVTIKDSIIANSSATNGGAIYWDYATGSINNVTIINNTATLGGGFYTEKFTGTIEKANFTLNKAHSGSAIYTTQSLTLRDTSLLKNRADTASFNATLDLSGPSIEIDFEGWDNYLNAMFVTDSSKTISCYNVTYLNESGIVNTSSGLKTFRGNQAKPTLESGQNFTVIVGDSLGRKLNTVDTFTTDENGHISITADMLGLPAGSSIKFADVYLTNQHYYTYVENTTRIYPNITGSTTNATFHLNGTVSANLTDGALGNVSVYIDGQWMGNITLEQSKGTINVSTLVHGKYLEVGNHTVVLKYAGDGTYRPINTTAILNVTRAPSRIQFNVTPHYYDFIINVTVEHNDTGIVTNPNDVTGNVTLNVRGQIINVQLVNGSGIGIAYNMPPGAVNISATYSGDSNYLPSSNRTTANITERSRTLVVIEVSAEDIYVNETIQINVTVVSNQTVTGNITVILDNEEYNLTLVNSTASRIFGNFTAGHKIVTAIFAGDDELAPSIGYTHFNVHKYDAYIIIDAKNITHTDEEVITLTVPSDVAQGTINVTINGTKFKYKHILEIINGTAEIDLSNLDVDVYNVTAMFESSKYKFTTNSSKFKVSPLKPPIIIQPTNVTYGNETFIFVEVVGAVGGNVTLRINDTLKVFENVTLVNDTASFTVKLPAGNYTIDVYYSGDESDYSNTAKSKFTVFKADPRIDIITTDIRYGDNEKIDVNLNAAGNVTVKVDGNVVLDNVKLDANNHTSLTVINPRSGDHTVEVIYYGNENFKPANNNGEFTVNTMDTKLAIEVDDTIPVWNTVEINVTVTDTNGYGYLIPTAPGNVSLYINGVYYTEKVIDSIATFHIDNLTVGDKVIWAFYDGDGDLNPSRAKAGFKVVQRTPVVNVTADNITTVETGKITVHVPSNATGYVIVTGNFTNYQIRVDSFNQGIAEIPLDKLTNGTYSVHIKYYGEANDNYTIAESDCTFKVSGLNVTYLNVSVDDIVYGDKANITVTIQSGATGTITLKLNDTAGSQITLPIINNKVEWIVENLAAGNYTVNVTYNGDAIFNVNNTNKSFNVRKATPVMTIDTPVSVDASTNATIVVRINETATGNITLTVNGTKYNATIENGVATFIIDKLLSGSYNITAEYIGDRNYTSAGPLTCADNLTVNKVDCYQINVTAKDTKVDLNTTIVVKVPADAVGNVSICIDGTIKHNVTISHGVAEWNVTMPYGNHTVNVTFTDGKYGFRYATTDYWVFKHDAPLSIDVDSIYVGDTAYINVTAPTDNVTIEINGKSYNRVKYENGIAYFEVSGLEYGNKTVVAIYGGSDKYLRNTTTANFTVNKRSTGINITVKDITYGDKVNITVNVTGEAKGFITIRINETRNVTLPIVNGKVNWIVEGLGVENYTVYANYSGDGKYNINSTSKAFKVTKVISAITIEESTADAATNATIVVKINETATGNITITVNGTKYNATIENGVATFTINKLLAGKYNITAEYIGDDNNTPVARTTLVDGLTITKVDCYQINVTAKDTKVDLNTTIVVKVPADAVGNVSICIDGTVKHNATISHGVAEWNVTMPYGNHTVNVTFTDGKYGFRYATTDYWVFKHDSPLDIEVASIYVGDTAYINVTAPTNNVTIEINGKLYDNGVYSGGKVRFAVTGLAHGNKTVVAIYGGSDKYLRNTTTANFTVSKHDSILNVTAIGNSVGNNATIRVNVTDGATGYVTINVNGTNYTINLTGSRGSVEIAGLGAGTYYVHATYIGDEKYESSINNTQTFTMTKSNVIMNITVNSIDYGQKANITVNITSDATGFITIRINNTRTVTLPVNKGKVSWIVDGLAADNYTVYANYSGDGKYNVNNTDKVNKSFEVRQISPNVRIVYVDSVAGENATVIVAIDSRATTTVNITVGKSYIRPIGDGLIIITTDKLENGTYTIIANYTGDKNFTNGTARLTFTTNKTTDYSLNITAGDVEVDDLTDIVVNVPSDAKGIVIININGTNYTATIHNGKAVFNNQTNLGAGRYNITAYFGNDKYVNKTAVGAYNIIKHNSTVEIAVASILVGDTAYINVTAPSDNVTIEINGKSYSKVKYENGVAYFEVSGLAHGNKTVVAIYGGDSKYVANSTTGNFTVSKRNSEIDVIAVGNAVGNNATITVNVTDTATGYVVVNVNGTNYTINLTGSRGSVQISGLGAGTYYVYATYLGDEKYESSINNTETFTMTKSDVIMNITVESIDYGQKANITVNITSDATGFITIRINNTRSITLPVNKGKVSWIVDGLAADNYTVYANYSGDGKYNVNNTNKVNKSFEVRQIQPDVDIIKVIAEAGKNATVIVKVDPRTTENITVNVNRDYSIKPNAEGIAVVVTDVLENGTYTVTVSYPGDRNFTSEGVAVDIVTNKTSDYLINITAGDIKVEDDTNITVNVPVDAKGIVIININGTNYTATINNGKAVFNNGTSGLAAGRYDITAYFGNAKYENKTATGVFYINKHAAPISIAVDSILVGDTAYINVTAPSDNVTIEINGKSYDNGVFDNGVVRFAVTGLAYGNKTVVAIYGGNYRYEADSTTENFTVSKRSSQVNVTASATVVGMDVIVNVTIPANATGYVIVNVNGTNYTVNTTNGNGSVAIKDLGNGKYTVNVTYIGDDQYLSSTNGTDFIISRAQPTFRVNGTDSTYGAKELIKFESDENITGPVIVEVDGKNYTAFIIEGKGNFTVENLAAGKHNVTVYFEGDSKYLNATANNTFTVEKGFVPIYVTAQNITYSEESVFTIYVNATGKVDIYIYDAATGDMVTAFGNIEIIDYKYTLPVFLDSGNYTVRVEYKGNENYTNSSAKANFTVFKKDPTIAIEVQNITYGGVEHIIVRVNAEGNVTIKVNGTEETIVLREDDNAVVILRAVYNTLPNYDGKAHEYIYNLNVGEYPVEVTFNGNENYNRATANARFFVNADNTTVHVDVDDIAAGGKETINVTISNKNATGNVTINVDGVNYTRPVTNGTANLTLTNLTAGNHSVVVIYEGDNNLKGNWTSATFNVAKVKPTLTIDVNDTSAGKVAKIIVNLPGNATGFVVIDVDGTKYHVDIVPGQEMALEVDNLLNKTYHVTAEYSGDEYWDAADNSTSFNVNITKANISVKVENITVGDMAVINITTPKELYGNVTVNVDDKNYTVYVAGGNGILVVPGLDVGNYTVNVIFAGTDRFGPNNATAKLEVSKVNVTSDDIKVIDQGNGTVAVVVGGNATGNVTVYVGGKNFTGEIVNGTAVVTLDNVTPGVNDIEVVYSGDDKHSNSTVNGTVTIPRLDTEFDVTVDEGKEGENTTITVKVPKDATGNVTVTIDGQKYTAEIDNGTAVITVENLTAGDKTALIEYAGDANYTSNYTTANFTVGNAKAVPDMKVIDQGNGTVVVVVGDNATGNVTIKVGDKEYNATVVNGTAVVQLDGNVTPGTHEVDVIYSGDGTHEATNTTVEITAPKYSTEVKVDASEVTEGEPLIITVEVPENATGNVTVYIDGKEYPGEIKDGVAVVTIDDLTAGNKTFVVEYSGDDNFSANYTIGNVTVKEAKSTPDMKVIDQGNGTVVVVVGDNASGNVTIKVGDKEYNATVVNGTAVVQLDGNVTPGTHEVDVIYSGDSTHEATNATVNITAPKYDSSINVVIGEAKEGEPFNVTVKVPEGATGDVIVNVGGKNYTGTVKDGEVIVAVDNLTAGDHTIAVVYTGDDNFTGTYSIGNLTVEKAKEVPDMKVIDYGNGTVVVVVGDNASGNVTIKVGDKEYNATVVNGTAVVQLDGNVTPGTHEVDVIYSGDDTHKESNTTAEITAPKYSTEVKIDASEVTEGEPLVVTVEVPDGATGNVTVYIDGKEYPGEVIDGVAVVTIDDLTAGDKTFVVEYSGDGNFSANYTIGNVTVKEAKSTPDIIVVNQGNGTVVVVVGDNATGNVTVKVGDNVFNATVVNGTAVVKLDNLTPGVNDIEVIYSGDDTHAGAGVNTTAIGSKYGSPIDVIIAPGGVGEDTIIRVKVPENATGNVTIEVDGVKYTTEVVDGNATFKLNNLTAGTKTIAVEYFGDGNYTGGHTTANMTISKVKSSVSATITDIDVGDNVTITVTVPKDATGQVLIDIDGVGYYVNVTNGTGTAQIPRMPNGIYPVNLKYIGDDKYLPSSNNTVFNVNKVPSYVIPTAKDITVGENEVIIFTVPTDATGSVTVVINGESSTFDLDEILGVPIYNNGKFNVAVDNGKGILVIPGMSAGEYDVSVTYNGDNKYLSSTNSTKFKVTASDCEVDVVDQGNGTVKVFVSDNATGNITIKVGNNTYDAEIVDGVAVIDLSKENAGKHDIEVIYSGDENHNGKTVESSVTIPKRETPIGVTAHDIYVGDTEYIVVTVPKGATGTVTIEINAVLYTTQIKDGKAQFTVTGLAFGSKTVAVIYEGDENYAGNFTTVQFEVKKLSSKINAHATDIKYGKDEVIVINVPKDATGHVVVSIDGVDYSGEIINGKVKLVIPNLPAGKYNAVVTYEGDDKYLPSSTTTSFKVVKGSTPISSNDDYIEVGDDAIVKVHLPSDATGYVTITVDGKEYTAEVIDGEAVFYIPGLDAGIHTVVIYYSGDDKYPANETTSIIVVADKGNGSEIKEGIWLSDYPTGNPILIALLVILAIGTTQIRRFRK